MLAASFEFVDGHFLAVVFAAGNVGVDGAAGSAGAAPDECDVFFIGFALFKLVHEVVHGDFVFGDDHDAAGSFVEPVHDAGAEFAADPL